MTKIMKGSIASLIKLIFFLSLAYFVLSQTCTTVDAVTEIKVCFKVTISTVSSLWFYLKGPATCGSPMVAIGYLSCTTSNVTNLCFSNRASTSSIVCSNNLVGTYAFYHSGSPFQNCKINEEWRAQVQDCNTNGISGTFERTSIQFSKNGYRYQESGQLNKVMQDLSCLYGMNSYIFNQNLGVCCIQYCKTCQTITAIETCSVCYDDASGHQQVPSADKKSCVLKCNITSCTTCAIENAFEVCSVCSDDISGYQQVPSVDKKTCILKCNIPLCKACDITNNIETCSVCSDDINGYQQVPKSDGSACEAKCKIPFCRKCTNEATSSQICSDCAPYNNKPQVPNADGSFCVLKCAIPSCTTCTNAATTSQICITCSPDANGKLLKPNSNGTDCISCQTILCSSQPVSQPQATVPLRWVIIFSSITAGVIILMGVIAFSALYLAIYCKKTATQVIPTKNKNIQAIKPQFINNPDSTFVHISH